MSYLSHQYDFYNWSQKNDSVTDSEIALIQTLCPPPANILDVGCGTGRHLIPLQRIGYDVSGIDSDAGMLAQLLEKQPAAKVTQGSIIDSDFGSLFSDKKFDLVISMWNSFNEYALNTESAHFALANMQGSLSNKGKILINIENADELRLEQLNFTQSFVQGEERLVHESKLVQFDAKTKISTCLETLSIQRQTGIDEEYEGELVQRWWEIREIEELAEGLTLKMSIINIPVNKELYILLS